MSRVFAGYASEGSVASVNSSAQVSAFSFSAWVNVTDPQSGGTIFVKDPVGSYRTYLEIFADGTLSATCGDRYLGGINHATIAVPGSGYAHNDTGTVRGGNPDIASNRADYLIGGAPGGIPADPVSFSGSGTGYAVGQTYTTAVGGGQPGGGSGLTLTVTEIINQTNALSQSVETVATGVWTHVAMTWNANGDGLVHLYINGSECTYQGQRTTSIHPDTSTGPLYIGDDTFDYTFAGDIAEAAFFGNTALTAGQVASIAASTNGVPSALVSSLTDYFHLCGLKSPEPNVVNSTNTGTVTNAAKGPNSPGYSGCVVVTATVNSIFPGSYGGNSLSNAFYNPHSVDIMQVVNEGGKVVWSLNSSGTATVNPGSSTPTALLGRFFGSSFATAFPNPGNKDVLQIVGPGDNIVFWVDYQGNTHP